jgi:hypothetical protein
MKANQSMKHFKNLFLLGLLAAALLLVACDTAVPAASAAPTNDVVQAPAAVVQEAAAAAPVSAPVAVVEEPVIVPQGNGSRPGQGNPPGNGAGPGQGQGTPVVPTGELTAAEIADVQYMREEEKLARDVYQTLYAVWGLPVFDNIAAAEQAHMDSVGYLLDSFGLDDPAAGNAQGVFTNPDLQALHDELVAQGGQSAADALLVGGAIEEIDILDLQQGLGELQNTAVIRVFENLLAGSENHLRAYAMNYERQTGAAYTPQYMSQEAYQAIISGTSGRGIGAGQGGNGRGNSGGQGQGRGAGGVGPTDGRGGPGNGVQN